MFEPIYELKNVTLSYKKSKFKANDNISFTIYKGEIIGILGPNGAGKTTLIKQMIGQLAPTTGTVSIYGQSVFDDTKNVLHQVAYYSQETFALSFLKTWEAIYFTGRLRGLTYNDAKEQTQAILERLEMTTYRNTVLKKLSGGQRRLISLGTALIGNTPIIILDEPTNELDPMKRKLVWNIIKERNQRGTTIILVTHNILEAEKVVHRVAVMDHGKLLALDRIEDLKNRVDQRMRLEMVTYEPHFEKIRETLACFGTVEQMDDTRLHMLVDKENASNVVKRIQDEPLCIRQFSLLPPSLEDVYSAINEQKGEPK